MQVVATPHSTYRANEVVRLAELAGLTLSVADAEILAEVLTAHTNMVAPLFEAELEEIPVAPTYDPRWRA